MVRAVVDTNVLVAAAITHTPDSPTVQVVNHILAGDLRVVYNAEILEEYAEVLSRPKFHLKPLWVRALIDFVRDFGEESSPKPFEAGMPDESDRVFYEISLSVEDSFLVTGNLKHYPATPQVVTPAQMVRLFFSPADPSAGG